MQVTYGEPAGGYANSPSRPGSGGRSRGFPPWFLESKISGVAALVNDGLADCDGSKSCRATCRADRIEQQMVSM